MLLLLLLVADQVALGLLWWQVRAATAACSKGRGCMGQPSAGQNGLAVEDLQGRAVLKMDRC